MRSSNPVNLRVVAASPRPLSPQAIVLLIVIVASALLVLAGCGDDGGQASPPSSLDASDEDTADAAGDVDANSDTGDNNSTGDAEDDLATGELEPGAPEADGGAPAEEDGPAPAQDLPRQIPPEFEGAVTLMPVGDSITMGRSDRPSWRYPFQNRTRDLGCRFDMVGTEDQWADGIPTSGYNEYDHHHQSVGGRTTQQSAQAVIPVAPAFQPDLVLIHTGTNDITKDVPRETTLSELRRMLRALVEARPDVQIYLAEIIPAGPARADATAEYNTQVREIAEDFAAQGTQIRTVDMFTGWDHVTMTVKEENIHPNQAGAEFIANRWIEALQADGLC